MLTQECRRNSTRALVASLAAVLCLGERDAQAQATTQIPLQFNFMTPGARSLGMGGAFVGAADDATTASANPAGLASLTLREASAEVRFQRIETPFLARGRLSGSVTNIGLDNVAGPLYATDVDDQGALSFLSLVVPFASTTLAFYRHEVARMENTFFYDGVFFSQSFLGQNSDNSRDNPLGGTRTIAISSYGGAVGLRISPQFSVGAGVAAYRFDLESDFARFAANTNAFGPSDRSSSSITATATQRGDDVSWAPNVGVVWSPLTGLKVGGHFRRGPGFTFTQTDDIPLNDVHLPRTGRFKVPDVMGAGVELRLKGRDDQQPEPSYALRVLADYTRVQYSQLKEDFVDIQALASGRPEQLRVDDGNELHGGVEVILLRWRQRPLSHPIFLRGGAWFDPDHAVRYEPTSNNDLIDTLLSATLPGGRNLMHYTFGAGAVLPHRIELNGAVDFSSSTVYVTTSTVFRF